MAIRISRRALLGYGAVAAAAWFDVAPAVAGTTGRRTFDWDDVYQRSDVEAAAVSAAGAIAIQVTRPLSAPGAHAGSLTAGIQPRGEIWLVEAGMGSAARLPLGHLWAWAPAFSPGGTRLAALISKGDGRVGLAVWDVRTRESRTYLDVNVDIYGKLRCDGNADGWTRLPGLSWKQFAWLDDDALIFVEHGEQYAQFDQAIAGAEGAYGARRRIAADGNASVRVWGDEAPTCGAGRRLARMDCATGQVDTVFRGDVRGSSISPDRRWCAVLGATGHIKLAAAKPVEPPLRASSVADDPLVSLGLWRIDLSSGGAPARVEGFDGVGHVAAARLPVWSQDSARFTVPSRATYSSMFSTGDDICWEVDVLSLQARQWMARSALDAELLAALISSTSGPAVQKLVEERPAIPVSPDRKTFAGQMEEGVWRYGTSGVVLWVPPAIALVDTGGSRQVPGEFAAVYSPVATAKGASMFAVRGDRKGCVIALNGLNYGMEDVPFRSDWVYLASRGSDGTVIVKEETDQGTRVLAVSPARRARTSTVLTFNRHFAAVAKPARREISRRASHGGTLPGVLQLPVQRSPGDRHPVVVWAYPDQKPSLDGKMTRLNSLYALWMPLQYLLTRGFAVFHAPLPTGRKQQLEPIDMVADAVLPWLDVLGHQPEILSGEYAFFGHSNGGYAALALEAQTDRFKAIAAYSTFPDLAATVLSGPTDKLALDCAGQAIQADRFYYEDENQPYTFRAPFWQAQQQWLRNSPVYRMESAATPLLLLQGEFDYGPRQMEEVFSILYGRGIPVELAYYWGDGHVLSSPGNIKDMWERTERFFRRHLRMA